MWVGGLDTCVSETLSRPSRRTCERCGRRERWDDATAAWRVVREADRPVAGDPFCLHEWDITGAFVPFEAEIEGTETEE